MRRLLKLIARALERFAGEEARPEAPAALPADPKRRDAYLRYRAALKRGDTQDQNKALHDLRQATTAELRGGQ